MRTEPLAGLIPEEEEEEPGPSASTPEEILYQAAARGRSGYHTIGVWPHMVSGNSAPVAREPNGVISRDRADTSYERPLRPRPT